MILRITIALLGVALLSGNFSSTANAADKEIVEYRLVKAKTMHLDDEQAARSYSKSLKDLRCESVLKGHAGHFDLTYRCSKWQAAEFASHAAAHKWTKWLASLGFETKHSH